MLLDRANICALHPDGPTNHAQRHQETDQYVAARRGCSSAAKDQQVLFQRGDKGGQAWGHFRVPSWGDPEAARGCQRAGPECQDTAGIPQIQA